MMVMGAGLGTGDKLVCGAKVLCIFVSVSVGGKLTLQTTLKRGSGPRCSKCPKRLPGVSEQSLEPVKTSRGAGRVLCGTGEFSASPSKLEMVGTTMLLEYVIIN